MCPGDLVTHVPGTNHKQATPNGVSWSEGNQIWRNGDDSCSGLGGFRNSVPPPIKKLVRCKQHGAEAGKKSTAKSTRYGVNLLKRGIRRKARVATGRTKTMKQQRPANEYSAT